MKVSHSLKFLFVTLFSGFIIVISVVTSVLGIKQLSDAVVDTFTLQGDVIVEKANSLIDGDSFEALAKSMNIEDPFYEETRLKLLGLKDISGCLYLYTMAPPPSGTVWKFIIDGSAEPDDEENFSPLGKEDDTADYDDAFWETIETGETAHSSLVYQEGWGWLISVYTPILNSAGKMVGITGCDFDGNDLYVAVQISKTRQLILGGVSVLIGTVLLIFFMHKIFTPITAMHHILKKIAQGEGDLTKRINIKDKNEIGELASDFNTTLEKIRNMIITIKKETDTLADTGNDLASSMNETAAGICEITEYILEVKTRVLSQSDYVKDTHKTMDEVVSNIHKLNSNVEEQSVNVASATSAIEEMVSNTTSVTNTLVKNAENVKNLKDASEAGRAGIDGVVKDIQEIARESEGLFNINAVMENISSQTNLLSMNAAIEAAHAGEAGRGFAVVAGEIRKLAESSGQQSKIISEVLKKIKESIDKIKSSTSNVLEKFEAIDSSVNTVAQQEEQIRNSMGEQQSGSRLILEGISNVNNITREVESGSQAMFEAAKDVIQESTSLETATHEIASSMTEMASGADQINLAVGHIKKISGINRENITVLVNEVSRFKV